MDNNNWIKIENGIPNQSGRYLIYGPRLLSPNIYDAYFSLEEKTWGRELNYTELVTHWMPLPEPPQD